MASLVPADPRIRRRWLLGILAFAAGWFLLLWPLANALYGLPGAAPDAAAQASRLIHEEVVKFVLVASLAALAAWVGIRTLATQTFPPADMRVPVALSITRGAGALLAGGGLLLLAMGAIGFRIVSLRVTLQLAELLRQAG